MADSHANPTHTATGIVTGMGRGLVGAVTKPIGGAADLVSQTGMGLLQGIGLTTVPLTRHTAEESAAELAPSGNLKYLL